MRLRPLACLCALLAAIPVFELPQTYSKHLVSDTFADGYPLDSDKDLCCAVFAIVVQCTDSNPLLCRRAGSSHASLGSPQGCTASLFCGPLFCHGFPGARARYYREGLLK